MIMQSSYHHTIAEGTSGGLPQPAHASSSLEKSQRTANSIMSLGAHLGPALSS